MTAELEESNGVRTHEPSLRELTAELDGLRDLILEKIRAHKELMDERDKRYTERDKDRQLEVEKALSASDKQTMAAFAASKEAITEAKKGQDSYNVTHNDLLRKTERMAADMMPRQEADSRLKALDEKIQEIKAGFIVGGGVALGTRTARDDTRSNIAILIAFGGLLLIVVRAWFGK